MNTSAKPLRVVTNLGTVGAYAVRVDGRAIQPTPVIVNVTAAQSR